MVKIKKMNLADYISCFSEYDRSDQICRNHCALRLRCAIEHEQNLRLQIFEELITSESAPVKVQ